MPKNAKSKKDLAKVYRDMQMKKKRLNIWSLTQTGQDKVAEAFVKKRGSDIKTSGYDSIFCWNDDTMLWEKINTMKLIQIVCFWIGKMFDIQAETIDPDFEDDFYKARKQCATQTYAKQITNMVIPMLNDKEFIDEIDTRTDVMNFQNGVFEFRTRMFRERTRDDMFSKCLDYDFKEAKQKYIDIVETLIRRIANDSDVDYEAILTWFGFCLTGETNKSFLILQGHLADNGKSTICKMFIESFPIYGKKIDRDFIYKNSAQTRHKIIATLNLYRMILIEELDRTMLDTLLLKEWSDGGRYPFKKIYGEEEFIFIQSKMNITTNKDPKFPSDNGIGTRGYVVECNNKFLKPAQYEKMKGTKGVYLQDPTLEKTFKTNYNYRRALLHLLLPYACKYYESGLSLPDSYKEKFLELCGMNDPTMDFINDYFEVTKDDNDRIHKDVLLQAYKVHSNLQRCSVNFLTSELKKYGIRYEKTYRVNNRKGCYVGIKQIKEIEKGDNNGVGDPDDDYDFIGYD